MEVNIEATVCGHCQSDLRLYMPIAKRCSRTEQGLAALYESLGRIDVGPASAIVGSIVLAFLSDYISWWPFADGLIALPFQTLAVLAPFFASILLGKFSGRASTIGCAALGAIAGLGGFAVHLMVWAFGALQSAYNACAATANHATNAQPLCMTTNLYPPHWYVSALTYPIAGALLFISGHALGRKFGPAPFAKWVDQLETGTDTKLRPVLETVIGLLTAVLPKLVEYWLDHQKG
jgi:hypothetical protein